MKSWQRGYPLETLRELRLPFDAHDAGLILGAFSRVNEAKVAEWLERGRLRSVPGAAAAVQWPERPRKIKDFRREVVATIPAGMPLVERLGYEPGREEDALRLLQSLGPRFAVWLWQEHQGDRDLTEALRLRLLAVKIRASSEVMGLWGPLSVEPSPLPARERLGLARLTLPPFDVGPLLQTVDERGLEWAQHYSSYNERGSWTALALRGFGGRPDWIEKPAEMSKAWKAEHADQLDLPCEDTPLRGLLPEAEPILAAIPGPKERVRLMRLAPGGGLSRHADITDLHAGCSPGTLLRIHVPLRTSEGCRFRSWTTDGVEQNEHMAPGEAWYLDTRKPHAARNASETERIHLVMDTWGTPELLALLPC